MTSRAAAAMVSFNTREVLRECLASVMAQNPPEAFVIDNGSTDGSVAMIKAEFPGVTVLVNDGNPGYGAALNRAIATCRSPYLLGLNSDTVLAPGALESLAAYLDQHPRAAIAGPRLHNPDGSLQRSCRRYPGTLSWIVDNRLVGRAFRFLPFISGRVFNCWEHDHCRVVPWVTGAAFCMRLSAVRSIGGFDESFFMYCEETDLCCRLQERGWEVHFTPVATVLHAGGQSTRLVRRQMAEEFARSNLHFYRRRYSRLRVAGLTAVMKVFFLVRLVRDWIRLRLGKVPPEQQPGLREDLAAWRNLLLGEFKDKPTGRAAKVWSNATR